MEVADWRNSSLFDYLHRAEELLKMGLLHCPRCQVRIARANHSGDMVHQCNSGNAVLDRESVSKIAHISTDPDGSTYSRFPNELLGVTNKLKGNRGELEGASDTTRTVHGVKNSIYRTRQHFQYIE